MKSLHNNVFLRSSSVLYSISDNNSPESTNKVKTKFACLKTQWCSTTLILLQIAMKYISQK